MGIERSYECGKKAPAASSDNNIKNDNKGDHDSDNGNKIIIIIII
jgi:hypothetical protein